MTHVFFRKELEGVATFWRIERRDGVALGFTSHNRDLTFDGLLHRAAPGMLPSALRRTGALSRDTLEVQGMLAHDAISTEDLRQRRYDRAFVKIGLIDWETRDRAVLFEGEIGELNENSGRFETELRSAKARLERDYVPRTSPGCRAEFCDAACRLPAAHYTHLCPVNAIDLAANTVHFTGAPTAAAMLHGFLRWVDGPQVGVTMRVEAINGGGLVLGQPLAAEAAPGLRAFLREGCDHTLATCHGRFANSVNFQGEPFLPGNDLLARYASSLS